MHQSNQLAEQQQRHEECEHVKLVHAYKPDAECSVQDESVSFVNGQ